LEETLILCVTPSSQENTMMQETPEQPQRWATFDCYGTLIDWEEAQWCCPIFAIWLPHSNN